MLVPPTIGGTIDDGNVLASVFAVDDPEARSPARVRAQPSWWLNQAAAVANRLVADELADLGARRHHVSLLAALDETGPASQADLGRRTWIDRSDVVAALDQLAAADLVVREPDPSDRRRNVVRLTPAGRRHLAKLDRRLARAQEALLADLDEPEREQLLALLRRVVTTAHDA